jgi:hypothetical protein
MCEGKTPLGTPDVDGKWIIREQKAWKVFIYLKMGTSSGLLLIHNEPWVA